VKASALRLEYHTPFVGLDGRDGALSAWFVFVRNAARALSRPRLGLAAMCALLAVGAPLACADQPDWPVPNVLIEVEPARDINLVRSQPVCVLNTQDSAGDLGRSLVVRHRREGDRLIVSYFVYWSSERPWGSKPWWLSLAIDAFYSHFLFVLPGIQRVMYGPGDVEGVTVVYRDLGDRLEIIEGHGDDEYHRRVLLGAEELTGKDMSTVLMTTSWSHQLGGRGAASLSRGASVSERCFAGTELVPLTTDIADRFRLGSASAPSRARYAWL
jgi:hypothetical protein